MLTFASGTWQLGETFLPVPNLVPNRNMSELLPTKVAGKYFWKGYNTLELKLRYVESPHSNRIICSFNQNKVAIAMRDIINRNSNNPELKGELIE